jgi:hypothetical protein
MHTHANRTMKFKLANRTMKFLKIIGRFPNLNSREFQHWYLNFSIGRFPILTSITEMCYCTQGTMDSYSGSIRDFGRIPPPCRTRIPVQSAGKIPSVHRVRSNACECTHHLERRLRSPYFIISNIDQPNVLLITCQLRSTICYGWDRSISTYAAPHGPLAVRPLSLSVKLFSLIYRLLDRPYLPNAFICTCQNECCKLRKSWPTSPCG